MTGTEPHSASTSDVDSVVPSVAVHPLGEAAVLAAHSRPALPVDVPSIVDHAIILVGEGDPKQDHAHFLAHIERDGWAIGQQSNDEIVASKHNQTIKWERHTEFIAFTRIVPGAASQNGSTDSFTQFLAYLTQHQPAEDVQKGLFARMRLVIETVESFEAPIHHVDFQDPLLKASTNGGAIQLVTDLRHNEDGLVLYLARLDQAFLGVAGPRRLGRFVQRVLEIESYRLLAYLSVPLMRRIGPRISDLETRVNVIAVRTAGEPKPEEEAAILNELTNLSAELQSLGSMAEFRFAASLAYSAIVNQRLEAIREARIEGFERLSNAVKRRLDPAMRSCEALLARQQKIADRVGTITDLLRTRVDLTLQEQNSDVLRSIDARADAQLRLQRTVEGLSIAAITYYTLGIIGYLVKGTPWGDWGYSATFVQAILVFPVLLLIYFGLRHARKKAEDAKD